jgi:hypothetical protein
MGRGPLPADLDLDLDVDLELELELDLDRVAAGAAAAGVPALAAGWDRGEEAGNLSPLSPVPTATMTLRQPSPTSIPFRT